MWGVAVVQRFADVDDVVVAVVFEFQGSQCRV